MGYYSRVRGDVSFTRKPQITDEPTVAERAALKEQLRALGGGVSFEDEEVPVAFFKALRDEDKFDYLNAFFEIIEDEAYMTSEGESGKAYGIEDEFGELVKVADAHDVLVEGIITVEGEEAGDIWRLVIKDNVVTHEETKIVWPDGSEYKG